MGDALDRIATASGRRLLDALDAAEPDRSQARDRRRARSATSAAL
jgi:hypothetical protein